MEDNEHDLERAGQSVLMATTLATFLLASSAFIWRSNIRKLLSQATTTASIQSQTAYQQDELLSAPKMEPKDKMSSRSKERRRRGKDPAKELLKGGKKAKELEKLVKEATQVERSRDSSRSLSSARAGLETPPAIEPSSDSNSTSNPSPEPPSPVEEPWVPQRPVSPMTLTLPPPPSDTPKRVSTPSLSPLSQQTQMASLRGALEASRMREEKTKADMDRITKEVEALRWESTAWRRREVELQTHIHHLMHQLQGYAALYASLSSPQAAVAPQHLQVPASPNGYHSPSPSPQPSPQAASMMSSAGLLSPVSMYSSPLSPFFAYPTSQHQTSSSSNVYSMLFPISTSSNTSSSESLSPESNGSPPLPPPIIFDRGRRRTRTRTQTANARMGSGWTGEDEHHNYNDDASADAGSESEDEFSEALADAILKRPESIKSPKRKKTKEKPVEEGVEFTFPSLNTRRETMEDDGWLQIEQQGYVQTEAEHTPPGPEMDPEPLIFSYHRPTATPTPKTIDHDSDNTNEPTPSEG